MSDNIFERYRQVKNEIARCTAAAQRPAGSVKLIAVSKTHPAQIMRALYERCREANEHPIFGENYVQEFKRKRAELPADLSCHYIGSLQRNKARDAVRLFSVIESVDSAALAEALDKEAGKEGKLQEIMLQVNISADPQKGGFTPDEAAAFLGQKLAGLTHLNCIGLMTITALHESAELSRPDFRALRELRDRLDPKFELSMGMSADYPVAIDEGATIVRVGTAIFGEREA